MATSGQIKYMRDNRYLRKWARWEAYLQGWKPFWHPVATVEEVDTPRLDEESRSRPLLVRLLSTRLAVARLNGEVVAFSGTCPHMGAGIGERGWISVDASCMVCGYHGMAFGGRDGRIASIPAFSAVKRGLPTGERWKIQKYNCTQAYGLVWVCLADKPRMPILEVPEASDSGFVATPIYTKIWERAGVGAMMQGGFDTWHFPFVHHLTGLGTPDYANAPDAEVDLQDDTLRLEFDIMQPVNRTISSEARLAQGGLEPVHYKTLARPNAMRLIKTSTIGEYIIVLAICPISPMKTRYFRMLYRNFLKEEPHSFWFDFENEVNAEDERIITTRRPWLVTTDLREDLWTTADDINIQYLRWMDSLGVQDL